jgi:hypothetical protein
LVIEHRDGTRDGAAPELEELDVRIGEPVRHDEIELAVGFLFVDLHAGREP